MEVTKKNFNQLLPEIRKSIDDCTFLAIDTELTGLYKSKSTEHAFDSMEERYQKYCELCPEFQIIQFGLSTFKYDSNAKSYTHRDFNFYVFPKSFSRNSKEPDGTFCCEISSLHFLAANKFDFNKVIYEGIPYLTPGQESRQRELLENKYNVEKMLLQSPKTPSKVIAVPDEHKQFVDGINEKVDAFIADESEKEISLEPCNAFQRKLIYDAVKQKHQTGITMTSKMNDEKQIYICIVKSTNQEIRDNLALKEKNELEELEDAVGFRKVLDHISESQKLVVGHHMYLDIFHTIKQFYHPLPEDLREYKSLCRSIFPRLQDTKCLASAEQIKPFLESTVLGELLKQVQGPAFDLPEICPEGVGMGYDPKSEKAHEAGFDSFMTGVCFIGLSRKIGSLHASKAEHLDPSSKLLSPYVNRFHIFRHYDISVLNLSGPDAEPDRDHVFYVKFPKEWKTSDLMELFLPYGNIFYNWLDDESALVALKSKENAQLAQSGLLNKPNPMYEVRSYSEYNSQSRQKSETRGPQVKRTLSPAVPAKRSHSDAAKTSSVGQTAGAEENGAQSGANHGTPRAKKSRKKWEDNGKSEVSSTSAVFDEISDW